jgi:hypothetical protein
MSQPVGVVRSRLRRIDPYVWLVLAFSLFAVLPLAGPGYFLDAHDGRHTIFFLTEFDAALRDGVWYPGWATDQALGYGYPTFAFYPPLAYYTAELFHLLGAGKVVAVKWTWALATVGAGLAMYGYARRVMGRERGLLAAIVYVYVPYHLVDIYVRAALAEYCAFVWMPLALWAFHRLAERVTPDRLALAGLTYGGLWITHNVTGLAFTPLLAAYVLFRLGAEAGSWRDGIARAAAALGGALLGLGIASALLLPNLLERTAINQEQWVRTSYDYARHFVHPFQLLASAWGYAPVSPGSGAAGGMSFQLGAVPLVLAVAAAAAAWWRAPRERALILFFAAATAVLILLMLPVSGVLWAAAPIAQLIQFPWRLLALTTVTLAVLAGLAVSKGQGTRNKLQVTSSGEQGQGSRSEAVRLESWRSLEPSESLLATSDLSLAHCALLVLVVLLGSFAYTVPQLTPVPSYAEGPLLSLEFEQEYPDMVGMTAWTQEQPATSPLVEQYQAGGPLVTAQALAPGATVEMVRAGGASDELRVRAPEGTALRFLTYYYPGWRVFLDGERLPDSALRPETPQGLLTVDIPPGEHHVLLRWGDTPLRKAGKALTLICLGLALALMAVSRRPRQPASRTG